MWFINTWQFLRCSGYYVCVETSRHLPQIFAVLHLLKNIHTEYIGNHFGQWSGLWKLIKGKNSSTLQNRRANQIELLLACDVPIISDNAL